MKKLFILVLLLSALPGVCQVSFIGQCSGTTSCTPPAHATGDLFIAYAGRDATTTAPTLPAGWTNVNTSSINGTTTADSVVRMACKVATTSSETATGFTNAGGLVVQIYRGQLAGLTAVCASSILGAPSFFNSTVNTTTTTETFNSLTNTDASSWIAGFGYAPAATAGIATAPSGMTNRSSSGTIVGGHDTNAAVASFTTANVTLTTAGRIITAVVEIKAVQVATPTFGTNGGTFGGSGSTTISDATASSTICYTLDGTTPAATTPGTCSTGSTYSSSATVSSDQVVIKAIGTKSGLGNSAVASSSLFTINLNAGLLPMGTGGTQRPKAAIVHHWQSSTCTGATCSVTTTGGTTAGNFVGITSSCKAGAGGPFKISSVSASLGTMTEAGVRGGATGEANGYYDAVYVKQSDSLTFAGPIVVTYAGTNGGCQVNIIEAQPSGGTLALDAVNDTWTTGTSTTFNGPSYTLTGSPGVQIQFAGTSTNVSSVASPYGNSDVANDETGFGTGSIFNAAQTVPNWTAAATVASMATIGLAFTFAPTTPSYFAMMDHHSGVTGNSPTAANLQTSTFGATGLCGASSSDCAVWDITNIGTKLKYDTSAYHALVGSAPRFLVGGTTYSDTSSVGMRYTTTNNTANYIQYFFPQAFDWPGNMSSNKAAVRWLFRTTLIPSDTLNVDVMTLFGSGTGGEAAFSNAILATTGSNLVMDLEGKSTSPSQSQITISTNTWYVGLMSYVANGGAANSCSGATCGRLRICDTSNVQVGSDIIIVNTSGGAGKIFYGNSNGLGLTAGKFIDFDKIEMLYAGPFTFPATGCF